MVKYRINIKFNNEGKSLNEKLTHVLKIEIEKKITNYSQNEGGNN